LAATLLARIGALLERVSRTANRGQLRVGDLVVNTLSKQVRVGRTLVQLSVKEFQLLATLAADPNGVFSKKELLETVWDFRSHGRTRTGEEIETPQNGWTISARPVALLV
jgi:DNA-binding response OmpR family regulator